MRARRPRTRAPGVRVSMTRTADVDAIGMERRHAAGADRDSLATKADLAELDARLTWRMIVSVLAANAATIAAVGWMLKAA